MTNDEPLDSRYLDWLYSQIAPVSNKNPARSFWKLAEQMFHKEFFWHIPNDDNRIGDAIDLREEFILATDAERDQNFMEIGCSFLEMLVALCRRAVDESSHDVYWWFRRILDNLNLGEYVDEHYDDEVYILVDDVLQVVIDRTYRPDGVGGLFPLRNPEHDQREVEIWYQMATYILENHEF